MEVSSHDSGSIAIFSTDLVISFNFSPMIFNGMDVFLRISPVNPTWLCAGSPVWPYSLSNPILSEADDLIWGTCTFASLSFMSRNNRSVNFVVFKRNAFSAVEEDRFSISFFISLFSILSSSIFCMALFNCCFKSSTSWLTVWEKNSFSLPFRM